MLKRAVVAVLSLAMILNIAVLPQTLAYAAEETLDTSTDEGATASAQCAVSLHNGDDLSARFHYSASDNDEEKLTFNIEIRGVESGNSWTVSSSPTDGPIKETSQGVYEGTLVLDSLDGTSFSERYCTGIRPLIPGEDIIISLEVVDENGETLASVDTATNSLFAYDPDADQHLTDDAALPSLVDKDGFYIARITCARHLRNLDASVSGLTSAGLFSTIQAAEVRAVQLEDIDFDAEDASPKATNFTPIINEAIAEYDGGSHCIRGLDIRAEDEAAGLFGSFAGKLHDLTLIDATVSSASAASGALVGVAVGEIELTNCAVIDSDIRAGTFAGGLIGEADGSTAISDCGVYLENASLPDADDSILISGGKVAGGLIGSAGNVSVNISGSYAAAIIEASDEEAYGGGLVGAASSSLNVRSSYADCYLSAAILGGLSGSCGADSRFDTCYSAGFAYDCGKDTIAAGFVPAKADVNNSYTVFNFDDPFGADGLLDTAYDKYAVTKGGSATSAYYAYSDADKLLGVTADIVHLTSEELSNALSGSLLENFVSSGQVNPYALTKYTAANAKYSYPMLSGIAHYGDWYVGVTEAAGDAGSQEQPEDEDETDANTAPASSDETSDRDAPDSTPTSNYNNDYTPKPYTPSYTPPYTPPSHSEATDDPEQKPDPEPEPELELFARVYETSETDKNGVVTYTRTLVYEYGAPTDTYGTLLTIDGRVCEWSSHIEDDGLPTASTVDDDPLWNNLRNDLTAVVFSAEVCTDTTYQLLHDCERATILDDGSISVDVTSVAPPSNDEEGDDTVDSAESPIEQIGEDLSYEFTPGDSKDGSFYSEEIDENTIIVDDSEYGFPDAESTESLEIPENPISDNDCIEIIEDAAAEDNGPTSSEEDFSTLALESNALSAPAASDDSAYNVLSDSAPSNTSTPEMASQSVVETYETVSSVSVAPAASMESIPDVITFVLTD